MNLLKNDRDFLNPYLLVFIMLFGILLIIPNGWNLRESRLVNLEILALIALSVCVFRVSKPLGLALGYTSASIPFHQAVDPGVMFALMSYAILYLVIASKKWNVEWLWNVICVAAILNVVWQVCQYFGLWILQTPVAKTYVGLLSNTNETSAFLAVCLPCFFRKGWKWLIPIPAIGLYLGISIGGIVAAGIAGILYLFLNQQDIGWKRVTLFLVAFICLSALYMEHKRPSIESNLNNRGRYWMDMIPICNMKTFGWGLGQFKFVMPLIQTPTLIKQQGRIMLWQNVGDKEAFERALNKASKGNPDYLVKQRWNEIWLEAHNEYLEIWFALGIVGLLLVLFSIFNTLKAKGDAIPKYGFLISCLSAIWFFSWQIVPCTLVLILYMGTLHGRTLYEKNT